MANKNCAACFVCRMVIMLCTVVMMMMMLKISAADPDMLQDVCVADYKSPLKVNGYACKSKSLSWKDFFYSGLAHPDTPGPNSTVITHADVEQIAGLNTMGVSLARVDYAPNSINPPHTHPRATEIVFVLEGELDVGFITTANMFINKTLKKGHVFVFPKALLHYQRNIAPNNPATAIVAFSSQLSGRQSVAVSLFAADPPVPDEVLAREFMIDTTLVKTIKAKFATTKK